MIVHFLAIIAVCFVNLRAAVLIATLEISVMFYDYLNAGDHEARAQRTTVSSTKIESAPRPSKTMTKPCIIKPRSANGDHFDFPIIPDKNQRWILIDLTILRTLAKSDFRFCTLFGSRC